MKSLFKSVLLPGIMLMIFSGNAYAQQSKGKLRKEAKEAAIKDSIGSGRYTFSAEYAQPLQGVQRYLTPDYYDLRIRKDSVIADLPYFGRVYMDVPVYPVDDGVKFTSTKFDYTVTPGKKGGWTVVITLHDQTRTRLLRLDVSKDGSTYLQVLSNTRDQIGFTGYIKVKEQ